MTAADPTIAKQIQAVRATFSDSENRLVYAAATANPNGTAAPAATICHGSEAVGRTDSSRGFRNRF
jgi:hypothetical protein